MVHHVEVQVLVLLLIASLVGMAARRMRVPYTLALVAAGLVLGFVDLGALHGLELEKDLLLLLFLPALLFEAALHIDPRDLRRELAPVLTLAVPGVLVAVGVTAGLLYLGLSLTGLAEGFGWAGALLFAAIIAATDPVSVLAIFKELGVPRRLYLLVEGESLLNDGVAVVVFVILAAALGVAGHTEGLDTAAGIGAYALRTFVWMAGGGVLIGLLVGGAVSALTRQIDDHLVETTLTTLVAYGSFLLAEQVHASGVLSTVTAAIVMGSYGRTYGMSVSTRVAMEDFWEYMAFLANSFVFLLVGLQLEPGVLVGHTPAILVAFAAVVLGRVVVVYGGLPIAARFATPVPAAWKPILVWGGLRGSLSMVLALSLPTDFAGRTLIINLVFGVVAASLFLQGLTIGPLLAKVGLKPHREGRLAYERARLRVLATNDGLRALDGLAGHLDDAALERLRLWYEARHAEAVRESTRLAGGDVLDEQLLEGLQELIDVERETIRHAVSAGVVSGEAAGLLSRELDERREELEHGHGSEADRKKVINGVLAARGTPGEG